MATGKKAAPPATTGKAVAKREEPKTTAVAALGAVDASLLMQDAKEGHGFSKEDVALPWLRVLQKGSPQVNRRDDAYVEGAEAGMFFNTVTKAIYDGEGEGILVVPCFYTRRFTEWKLREKGGGLIKDWGTTRPPLATQRNEKNQDIIVPRPDHQLVESMEYYLLLVDPEDPTTPEQVVLSLQSTQMKKGRNWNSQMQTLMVPKPDGSGMFNPAKFYQVYNIKTVYESNDFGDWMGVEIATDAKEGSVFHYDQTGQLYLLGKQFAALCAAGSVKVQPPVEDAEVVTVEEEGKGREF